MDVLKDKRFSGIVKDPRFKKVPRKQVKTEVDKRFHGMFSGKHFAKKFLVDKRGSPLDHKVSEDFQKFYHLNENEQDIKPESSTSDEDNDVDCQNDEEGDDECKNDEADQKPKSDDDDDDSTSTDTEFSEDEQEDEICHNWHELDSNAPRSSDITRRLAVCNMDWDRLRAEDFLVVFNSFKPSDGVINSVKIYPSEYGLERLEKEKLHGPAELIEEKLDSDDNDASSSSKGSRFHQEKLRQYQINRLKYFFAVVDCDSPTTADTLYEQLNGLQFESSGCILDLRFIPDDMTFEQEPVSVSDSLACPEDYKPTSFVTSALNQVKVDLTWDETDPRRKEILQKAFTDPESLEKDLQEYLASPSESEDELEGFKETSEKLSTKEAIARYKALLQTLEEKANEEKIDLEVTWEAGLKEKTEELVKQKAEELEKEKNLSRNLTPFEEKLQKKKDLKKLKKEKGPKSCEEDDDAISSFEEYEEEEESEDDERNEKAKSKSKKNRKKKRKFQPLTEEEKKQAAELALLMAEPGENNSSDSDNPSEKQERKKKKKDKRKAKKEEPFMEHIDDPRFAAVYTNHLFHIDPSDPKFKEMKRQRASVLTQKEKREDFIPLNVSHEISKEEDHFIGGSRSETQKAIKIEALKKKLSPFCKKFQKRKKEFSKSEEQGSGHSEKDGDSTFMADISAETSIEDLRGKRKKRRLRDNQKFSNDRDYSFVSETTTEDRHLKKRKKLLKHKKQSLTVDNFDDQNSSGNAAFATGANSSAAYYGEEDDSDILLFSSGPTKKRTSVILSKNSPHTNSFRKKVKKNCT